ncbi:MAG TPA: adenylate/guanylate cyclase domain-containing protein [Streptosporangiaceae bacterium]|nr:adenylate/guanylate cyclase domain-containing protein [Streptosporangiaceae bacterium]
MSQLGQIPSGTVTLLFTDVEGSTRLWEAEPDSMATALRQHDHILSAAIEQAGGYVFKTVGDAFCAAFWTAPAALAAALGAQRALGAQDWPTSRPVRVRMGMHSGVCEERDGDYFGPVVNRAARLEAVAHGGQVLASGATAELLSESLPGGVSLRDLGSHRLKDLGRPEQVFQLEAKYLDASFPPLASLDNPELPNNLPGLLSAFIGREQELEEIRVLARSSRLLTLTGAGGSGKTRLALQAAAELIDLTADGVWLVELAQVTRGDQVPGAVAAVLGLADHGEPTQSAVTEALSGQDALILLDNCEHVVDAAAKFCDQVIRHCPRVRILATSREPLGIDGERIYRVPSLSLPAPDAQTAADLADCDAVRLFTERARAHDAGFILTDSVAPLVATICQRLDGIPLALELAAARLSSMSVQQVCERLDQRFRLLTGGSRNAMPRQQTLQATVDWSFSLLTAAERQTLARLSVFAGSFELEAAEAICATESVDAFDVLDLLGSLVSKSLVVADRTADAVRYRLLETIRQYSAEELLRSCDAADVLAVRAGHAYHYLWLAETAAPELTGPRQDDWLQRLDLDWDNLRAAVLFLEAEHRVADVLRLAVALERFAGSRLHTEMLGHARRAVDDPAVSPSLPLGKGLLTVATMILTFVRKDASELPAARAYAERALRLAADLPDRRLEVRSLNLLAAVAGREHDRDALRRLAEQSTAAAREIGDMQLLGDQLALLAHGGLSNEETQRIALEALACFRQCGDQLSASNVLHLLSGNCLRSGLVEEASAHIEQALVIAERLSADLYLYFLRSDLGLIRLIQGRHAEAAQLARWCLQLARRVGVRVDASEPLLCAAYCTGWQGDHARAAMLLGAADADIAAGIGVGTITMTPPELEMRERETHALRAAMGDAEFDQAYRAGSVLSPAQAIELVLSRPAAEPLGANSV